MSSLDNWFEFDCGCRTKAHGDGSGAEIEYCDLHYSAPIMQRALIRACNHLIMDIDGSGKGIHSHDTPEALKQVRDAIAKSTGKYYHA